MISGEEPVQVVERAEAMGEIGMGREEGRGTGKEQPAFEDAKAEHIGLWTFMGTFSRTPRTPVGDGQGSSDVPPHTAATSVQGVDERNHPKNGILWPRHLSMLARQHRSTSSPWARQLLCPPPPSEHASAVSWAAVSFPETSSACSRQPRGVRLIG